MNASVGTLIYSQKTKRYLFLLRRAENHDSTWGFLSGKVEDETVYEALLREIQEEIGEVPGLIRHMPVEKFTNERKGFEFHTFVTIVEDEFVPNLNAENRGYAWTDIESYPKPLHPGVYSSFNADEIMQKFRTVQTVYG